MKQLCSRLVLPFLAVFFIYSCKKDISRGLKDDDGLDSKANTAFVEDNILHVSNFAQLDSLAGIFDTQKEIERRYTKIVFRLF